MEVLKIGQDEKWTREILDPSTKSRIKITADDIQYCYGTEEYYVVYKQHAIVLMEGKDAILIEIPKHVREEAESRYWEDYRLNKVRERQERRKKTELEIASIKNLFLYTPLRLLILLAVIFLILVYFLK